MERVHTLIDKLCQQKQQNTSAAHLLYTVQMLHAELLQATQKNTSFGTTRVSASLPVNLNFIENMVRAANVQEEVSGDVPVVEEKVVVDKMPVSKQTYNLQKPAEVQPAAAPQQEQAWKEPKVLNPALQFEDELPGLFSVASAPAAPVKEVFQLQKAELHEVLGESGESLNDRLKEEKTELGHVLTGSPIKDLKKAIGVNDRYTYINELFRGDEAMYDRSLKTINGFHVYSEAEYWIKRELTLKLGWNERSSVVQNFYHLVRRRFS